MSPLDNAKLFLEQKLRETIAECDVPALGAVLVRDEGHTMVAGQQGIRKVGATGVQNNIQPHDKFNLGSISKVFTGNLIGKLIQNGVGNFQWDTKLIDVYPNISILPGVHSVYKNVTIEQFLVHTSGMPYTPSSDNDKDYLSWTAIDLTKPKLMKRRFGYVTASVLDVPLFQPGQGYQYGGGGIICAAMAEHRTGKTYEDLMKEHIYNPLGMTNSGFGVLSPGVLDGTWQHGWDPNSFTISPDLDTKKDANSWHPRNSVGGACCSAADMGKFLREQVRPDPQVFDKATRATMQTHQVTTAGSNVRGAWGSTKPGSAQADIWHNGDNLVSYAHIVVSLWQKIGYGAMSNVNSTFGAPAVNEMLEVTRAMHSNWNALFSEPNAKFWECAHPMPAVVMAGQKMIVFGRQHDGKVLRRRSMDAGVSWQADGNFENGVFTSGMAAGISSNGQRIYVFGRGTDNRIWFAFSTNGGTNWKGWDPIGTRTFQTGSAVTVDASGNIINVFAIGMDRKMYRTHSINGGQNQNWSNWEAIGQGVFTSAPAAAASSDGKIIHVFGRGTDHRIWRNESQNSGASSSWLEHWEPIGKGTFTSGIAAAASSNGFSVQVIGRGTDRKLWRNSLSNSGTGWLKHWKLISERTFTSAPSIAMSSNGSNIDVFAFGGDFRICRNHSTNGGDNWANWEEVGSEFFL